MMKGFKGIIFYTYNQVENWHVERWYTDFVVEDDVMVAEVNFEFLNKIDWSSIVHQSLLVS